MVLISLEELCGMDSNKDTVGFVSSEDLGMAVIMSMNKRTCIHINATDALKQRVYYCLNWRTELL
jgi:hypothetical protein